MKQDTIMASPRTQIDGLHPNARELELVVVHSYHDSGFYRALPKHIHIKLRLSDKEILAEMDRHTKDMPVYSEVQPTEASPTVYYMTTPRNVPDHPYWVEVAGRVVDYIDVVADREKDAYARGWNACNEISPWEIKDRERKAAINVLRRLSVENLNRTAETSAFFRNLIAEYERGE